MKKVFYTKVTPKKSVTDNQTTNKTLKMLDASPSPPKKHIYQRKSLSFFLLKMASFATRMKISLRQPSLLAIQTLSTDPGRLSCNVYTVNDTQCEYFRIFQSLRFYVKSTFGDSRSAKTAIFANFGALNFDILVDFSLLQVPKLKKPKFSASKYFELVDFILLKSPKSISRKL